MKIAVNTRFLIKGKMTGLGHFTFELLKQLVVQHPEDEFIFLFDRKIDPDFVFASNIEFHPVKCKVLLIAPNKGQLKYCPKSKMHRNDWH